MLWLGKALIAAIGLACLIGVNANAAQNCGGHDGDSADGTHGIRAFKPGSPKAHWDALDFGPSVATMNNVTLDLKEKDSKQFHHITFDQMRPLGYLKSSLYAEVRNPNQEIKLFGIWGDSNRPDPPRIEPLPIFLDTDLSDRRQIW